MIAASVGGGFKLDEIYGNLSVRFSMRVTIERKLFINTSTIVATRGKHDGKIQAANCFIEPNRTCFRKQMLVNFCWQHFGYDFEVLLLDSSERSLIE